jgi:putative Holliday junction resolvase
MRFLGIDFGTKRIGIALSDEGGTLAFPKEIVTNDQNALSKIAEIIKAEDVTEIVVGESVDLAGKPNPVAKLAEEFVATLSKLNLPIHKQQEFLTSVEARKAGETKVNLHKSEAHSKIKELRSEKVDASAAALILQRYLDRKNYDINR